ncbi:MAG: hypothetical protein AAFR64_08985 [Pseudomonadota bacterium]
MQPAESVAPPQGDADVVSDPQLSSEDRAALRCAAAFALVGARQQQGQDTGDWPEIGERGREFFVVALAGLMDEYALDRPAIDRLVRTEAEKLMQADEVDTVMPACLLMLQASGF